MCNNLLTHIFDDLRLLLHNNFHEHVMEVAGVQLVFASSCVVVFFVCAEASYKQITLLNHLATFNLDTVPCCLLQSQQTYMRGFAALSSCPESDDKLSHSRVMLMHPRSNTQKACFPFRNQGSHERVILG